jgi:outer membrane protein
LARAAFLWTAARVFSLVLILSSAARASTLFTWDQSVERVSQTNEAIQSARFRVRSFENQETVAASNFYPQLTGRYDAGYSGDERDGSDVSLKSTLSLSLTQNLFAGLSDYGRVRQAEANTRGAQADLITARAQAGYDLKTNFEGYAYANEYVELANEIIKRRLDNLQMVQLRYESGRENKGSVLLSRANFEQAKYELITAQNAQRTAKYGLAAVLAIENPEEFEITGAVPVQSPGPVPSFIDLLPSVPEHLRAVATAEGAQYGIGVARAGFLPTLDVTASLGDSSLVDFTPDTRSWTLGVRLVLPIFNGLSDLGNIRSAAAAGQQAEFSRRSIDRAQLSNLVQAYNNYIQAVTKFKVDQSFRDAALVRAEIGRRRYNNGLLSFEDWDVIENDLINRQKNFLQSKRDRVIAEAAWERAQGRSAIP